MGVATGRPSIFRGKDRTKRVVGYLTKTGTVEFERARKRLATLVQWRIGDVTNSDVVEFLSRGEANALDYLKDTGQIQ